MMKKVLILFALFAINYVNSMENNKNDEMKINLMEKWKGTHEEKTKMYERIGEHCHKLSERETEKSYCQRMKDNFIEAKERIGDDWELLCYFYDHNKSMGKWMRELNQKCPQIRLCCAGLLDQKSKLVQIPLLLAAVFNLVAPAFLELEHGLHLSFTQFLLVGSGYCFTEFDLLESGLLNFGMLIWNGYHLDLINHINKFLDPNNHGMIKEGSGELDVKTQNAVLQRFLIITIPAVCEIFRARDRIWFDTARTDEQKRKYSLSTDTGKRILLSSVNVLTAMFLHTDFYAASTTFSLIGLGGFGDKYTIWLVFAANLVLLYLFGLSDHFTIQRFEINVLVGLVAVGLIRNLAKCIKTEPYEQ